MKSGLSTRTCVAMGRNRAENGRARNHVKNGAGEKGDSKSEQDAFRIAEQKRREPLLEEFGIGLRLEHALARLVDDP